MAKPLRSEVLKRYPYHSRGCQDVAIMSKYPFTLVPNTTLRNRQNICGEGTYHTYGKVFDLVVKGKPLRLIALHMQSIGLSEEDKHLYKEITSFDEKVHTGSQLRHVKHSLTDKLASAAVRRSVEAQAVRKIIDESQGNIIVCGDLNDVPRSYTYFTLLGNDMNDVHVECGTLPVNTYNRDWMYFKIDHMFYRGDMRAVNTRCDKAGASDHYPVITTFEWTDAQ